MEISRNNQMVLADIILRVLSRGLCAVSMFDKRVAADIETLGEGFSFSIYAGASAGSPNIRLKTENGRFIRVDEDDGGFDVVIRFKDLSGIMPVLLGRTSVASAFAQHRMLIWGSVNRAVALVRIIDITEAYIFPKTVIKKAMRSVPKKQTPSLFVYLMLLFAPVHRQKNVLNRLEYEKTTETAPEQSEEPFGEQIDEQARQELGVAK